MPIFATLVGSIASALVGLFARFLSFKLALRLASYTTWLGIYVALLGTVYVCLSSLYAFTSSVGATGGVSWMSYLWVGLGMFIPANAGAVMSCVASIWIATGIYSFQKNAVTHFGG